MQLNRIHDAEFFIWSINLFRTSKSNKFISDITKWYYNNFSQETFDCLEYETEYTDKYSGISDINYERNIRFRSAVDILHQRRIKKKRISQFKRGF